MAIVLATMTVVLTGCIPYQLGYIGNRGNGEYLNIYMLGWVYRTHLWADVCTEGAGSCIPAQGYYENDHIYLAGSQGEYSVTLTGDGTPPQPIDPPQPYPTWWEIAGEITLTTPEGTIEDTFRVFIGV